MSEIGWSYEEREHARNNPKQYPEAFLWGLLQLKESALEAQTNEYNHADWEPVIGYLESAINEIKEVKT